MQRELAPKVTEGLFYVKTLAFLTIPPSFSCENATSLYTREALDCNTLIIFAKYFFMSILCKQTHPLRRGDVFFAKVLDKQYYA